jgi:hypothetical protein
VTLSAIPVPHPCSTLDQRWSACRDRVYRAQPVYRQGFGYMNPDKRCSWWEQEEEPDRRPCTSPRRNQCRAGASPVGRSWANGWPGDLCTVQRVPYGPIQRRMRVPIVGGRWDWFNAELP